MVVDLDGENPVVLQFEATAGQTIRAEVLAADDDDLLNDPVVAIISPGAMLLAYNNNAEPDTRDALIPALTLPIDGTYTLYVNTYGGIYAGELTVRLEAVDPFNVQMTDDDTRTLTLPAGQPYRETLTLTAGDTLTVTARDLNRTLDPALALYDAQGEQVAFNDDHPGVDLTLDAFDAQLLDIAIVADGEYTLMVWDLMAVAGELELKIEMG